MSVSTIKPTTRLEMKEPQLRTPDVMHHDMRKKVPHFPDSTGTGDHDQGAQPQARRGGRKQVKPFRPMMDAATYTEHKAKPHSTAVAAKPAPPKKATGTHAVEQALAPATLLVDIAGATDVDGEMPPDTHGAVGATEFVEVTNSHVDIYQKSNPTNRTSISHAAFFGYFTQALFDARVVYDSAWNRWVITADAFAESATVQYFFVAVSTTSDATGPFYIYQLNVAFNSGDFWDYPQLGMDQDAIIITGNIFPAAGGFSTDMFAVAKARLYNGLGFSVPLFTGLVGTLAPPIVIDQNPNTFLIAAQPNASALQLYTLHNSGTTGIGLTGPVNVPVTAYTTPPAAPQPGTSATLDTLDSRFVNASTQVGDSLWQVHTINLVGFAAPRLYQINTATHAVVQSTFFFATGTSHDFNASIAANSDNDVFLTWTTTDPPVGTNAQVRYAGCDHNDGPPVPGAGSALFTSSTSFAGGRWGDYSAVTVDPANTRQAWLVNEDVEANADWGSRIANIGF